MKREAVMSLSMRRRTRILGSLASRRHEFIIEGFPKYFGSRRLLAGLSKLAAKSPTYPAISASFKL